MKEDDLLRFFGKEFKKTYSEKLIDILISEHNSLQKVYQEKQYKGLELSLFEIKN